MPYRMKPPDPETLIAENPAINGKLYAELADVPLYAKVRLLAPLLVGKRSSFRFGWVISEGRLAHGGDRYKVPAEVLAWIESAMAEAYSDHATATGLTPEEVAELEQEQAEKKLKFK